MTKIILDDVHSPAYQRRHSYVRREVEADGKIYGVTSVLPMGDMSYRCDSAVDKLRYLVSETKH